MRITPDDRRQLITLVALGGPADGKVLTLPNRRDVVVMETMETSDGLPPMRSRSATIGVRQHVYSVVKVAADRNVMTARGGEHYRVLVPSEIATHPHRVEELLDQHGGPTVDGGFQHGKTGRPGDGCTATDRHDHWCGSCGAVITFGPTICQRVTDVPPCHCGSTDWRTPRPAFPDWIWP